MLEPILALIAWSLVMLVWLYATRIPAMFGLGLSPSDFRTPAGVEKLPPEVNAPARNYAHLMEQPTLFYVVCLVIHTGPFTDDAFRLLAWLYVVLRIVHSLIQATSNIVIMRFMIFACSTLILAIMAWRAWLAIAS
jgi:hypothetical protein